MGVKREAIWQAFAPYPPLSSPGSTGRPSTPRLYGSSRAVCGILDRPVRPGDDTEGVMDGAPVALHGIVDDAVPNQCKRMAASFGVLGQRQGGSGAVHLVEFVHAQFALV